MKLTILILNLFFFLSTFLHADSIHLDATAENYNRLMALSSATDKQVDSLIQLSISYSYVHQDTSILIGEKSVELGRQLSESWMLGRALLELGDTYRIFGDIDKGEALILEGIAVYEKLKDEGQIAYGKNKMGALETQLGNYESALKYYISALEAWEKLKDSSNLMNPILNIGLVFSRMRNYKKANEYNAKAMALAKLQNNDRIRMYALNNQSLDLKSLSDYYVEKAEENDNNQNYLDSSEYYLLMSLSNHEEALGIAKSMNNKQSIIRSLVNIGQIQLAKGDIKGATTSSTEAEILLNDLKDVTLEILTYRNLAECYLKSGELRKAELYGLRCLALAKSKNMDGYIAGADNQLYQTYKEMGLFQKAMVHLEGLKDYSDRIGEINKNKAISEIEGKYQNVEKQNRILAQENEIIILEQQNLKAQKQRNMVLGGSVFLGLMGFMGVRMRNIRKERNDKIQFAEALIYAQEEERKRIARDLHDGVGQSLLLLKKQLESTHEVSLENKDVLSKTLDEVRTISRDLHPFKLEKFGLTSAIEEVLTRVGEVSNIFVSKSIDNIDKLFDDKTEINIYRTVQEALSNIIKHSDATAAKLDVVKLGNKVKFDIMDNGKGFDYEMAYVQSKSLGLKTMSERINSIGGNFSIKQGEAKGTVVSFIVPVK